MLTNCRILNIIVHIVLVLIVKLIDIMLALNNENKKNDLFNAALG